MVLEVYRPVKWHCTWMLKVKCDWNQGPIPVFFSIEPELFFLTFSTFPCVLSMLSFSDNLKVICSKLFTGPFMVRKITHTIVPWCRVWPSIVKLKEISLC